VGRGGGNGTGRHGGAQRPAIIVNSRGGVKPVHDEVSNLLPAESWNERIKDQAGHVGGGDGNSQSPSPGINFFGGAWLVRPR